VRYAVTGFLEPFAAERQELLSLVEITDGVWRTFEAEAYLDPGATAEEEGLVAQELNTIREALAAHRFDVGLFGLIKRGKSTLLNALLGTAVSATSITPETAVPVTVEHGVETAARVHFVDGRVEDMQVKEARQFTSQKTNRTNELGVTYVGVRLASPLLGAGVRLIDTPGMDDAEADEVYTQRILQELDSVDAGILVVLSPPTIGGREMDFLKEVIARNLQKVLLVVNMYPQHYYDEESKQEVLDYVSARVAEATGASIRIYPICAIDAWEARQIGFEDGWQRSGGGALLDDLEADLVSGAGRETIRSAAIRLDSAVDLAEGEVQLRREMVSDPERLKVMRDEMRAAIEAFGEDLEAQLEQRLERLEPLRIQLRSLLLSIFFGAKHDVSGTKTIEQLQTVLQRFRREAEVAANSAVQQFRGSMAEVLQRLEADLGERSGPVMAGLTADLETETIGVSLFEDLQTHGAAAPAVGGAAVGGVLAGGGALVALGAALGPLGLVGGALVGWRLAEAVTTGREAARARETVLERLDGVAEEFAAEFDRQVDGFVEAVREAVRRRPAGLKVDLETQLAAMERLTFSPQLLAEHLAGYDRMSASLGEVRERLGGLVGDAREEVVDVTVAEPEALPPPRQPVYDPFEDVPDEVLHDTYLSEAHRLTTRREARDEQAVDEGTVTRGNDDDPGAVSLSTDWTGSRSSYS
jgi:hypothetical protein